MTEQVQSTPWFALHIRMHDHENVKCSLTNKGYEVLSPSFVETRIAAGREKRATKPLFPGYLFCAFDPKERLGVMTVPSVIRILGLENPIRPVPTSEIDAIRVTLASGFPVEPFSLLQPGEPVEVKSGPLAGVKGVVVYHKGKYRVIITVSALNGRAVSVEVDRATLANFKLPAAQPVQVPLFASVAASKPPAPFGRWQALAPDLREAVSRLGSVPSMNARRVEPRRRLSS